jgi:hypothetical protein
MLKPVGIPSLFQILVLSVAVLIAPAIGLGDEVGGTPGEATASELNLKIPWGQAVAAADVTSPTFVFTPRHVFVPENSVIYLKVVLSSAPAESIQGEVVHLSGDPGLSISSGGSFNFSTTNWQTPVVVKLAAGNDSLTTNGLAVFAIRQKVTVPGTETFASTTFTATLMDNDGGVLVDQDILEDAVWDSTTTTYHVSGTVTITSGAKLTIRPGVLVELKTDGGVLANGGALEADGAVFWGETNAKSDSTQKNMIQLRTDSVSTLRNVVCRSRDVFDLGHPWDQYPRDEAESGLVRGVAQLFSIRTTWAYGYWTTYGFEPIRIRKFRFDPAVFLRIFGRRSGGLPAPVCPSKRDLPIKTARGYCLSEEASIAM